MNGNFPSAKHPNLQMRVFKRHSNNVGLLFLKEGLTNGSERFVARPRRESMGLDL